MRSCRRCKSIHDYQTIQRGYNGKGEEKLVCLETCELKSAISKNGRNKRGHALSFWDCACGFDGTGQAEHIGVVRLKCQHNADRAGNLQIQVVCELDLA